MPASPVVSRRPSLRRISSSKLLNIQDPDVLSTAEIRSVAVLFIKIDVVNMSLVVDEDNAPVFGTTSSSTVFHQRTLLEVSADHVLLAQLQSSFECIASALDVYGGQMRQFIVDDKGETVAFHPNYLFSH
jgi:hypothetical protein